VLSIDPDTRTVIVRPAADADGYAKLLWRQGHAALVKAEQTRGRSGSNTVWAHSPGHRQVAYATPGQEATLRFKLSPDDYREITNTPDLRAVVVVDRATSRILNVSFRGSR